MNRTAILVNKNLSIGEQANIIAIISGGLAAKNNGMYFNGELKDLNGNVHAGILNNLVVLKSNPTALLSFCENIQQRKDINHIIFTQMGQRLSNEFPVYKKEIEDNTLLDLNPVGVGVFGEDSLIRDITKKFSLMR